MEEQKLFNLIKSNLIPDLVSTDEFNPIDATSEKFNIVLELKCRNYHYITFLIERKKYNKLINNPKCRYIVSTPNGIFSFNLKKIKEPVWQNKWLPASNKKLNYVEKEIGYIHINEAKDITNLILK